VDHYEALGVPRGASREEVKRAYRKRAQRTHPDKTGGDAQAFGAVQRAWDVLGDDAKRSRYDRGEETGAHEPTLEERVLREVAAIVINAVQTCPDPASYDILGDCAGGVRQKIEHFKREISDAEKRAKRLKDCQRRIKRKNGRPNVISAMLDGQLAALARAIAAKRSDIELCEHVVVALGEYTYQVDAGASRYAQVGTQVFFRQR
jgi:curved DNA-binding protein CbpA